MPRKAAVRVPGVPVGDTSPVDESPVIEGEGQAADTVAVEMAGAESSQPEASGELAALMAQLKALSAEVATLRASAPAKRSVERQEYPDAATVDPKKIKASVLTKQGWVVPESLGTHPNAPKAF